MITPTADFSGDNASLPFIIFASNQGAWGNKLVVEYANFDDAVNEFDITVYEKTIPAGATSATLSLLETNRVSRSHKLDGFGKQMYLMDKVNGASSYIWVEDNTAVAETANVEHKVADEALFTGDNVLTSFAGNLSAVNTFLIGKNIERTTVGIDLTGDGEADIIDNGRGALTGTGVTGTVDYGSGAYTLEFTTAPAATVNAVAAYSYSSARQLSQGADGAEPTLADMVAALKLFEDRESISVNLMIQPSATGLNESDTVALQKEVQRICELRDDCYGILNLPSDKKTATDAYAWMRQTQKINSSYVGTYGPDLKIRDNYNGVDIEVPPAGFVAAAFADTDARYGGPHIPAAGIPDGVLDIQGVASKFTEGDYDLVYPENLNLVLDFQGTGPVIWGARTNLKQNTYLRDANIRRLLLMIRANVRKFLRAYHFKINTEFARLSVTTGVTDYLETVAGLRDFRVVCNGDNNTDAVINARQLNTDMYIRPELMIEFIQLRSILVDSNVEFTENLATGGSFL